jgi:hypothetical protein
LYYTYNDQQSFRQFFGYESTNHDSSGSSWDSIREGRCMKECFQNLPLEVCFRLLDCWASSAHLCSVVFVF